MAPPIAGLLREHGPFLRRLALALVRDEHAAEDLVHDTWLAALRHPAEARDPRAWLSAVLRRRAVSFHRRRGTRREVDDAAGEVEETSGTSERLERGRELHGAVGRLPEPYRTVVVLRYLDELPPRAIAARTGTPIKTVQTRLARGLALLRADLVRHGAGERGWLAVLTPLLPSHAAPAQLGGGAWLPSLTVKKTVLAVSCVLLVAVLWRTLGAPGRQRIPLAPPLPRPAPVVLAPASEGPDAPAVPAREDAAAARTPTVAATARLVARVRDAAGAPSPGRRVQVRGPLRSGEWTDTLDEATGSTGEATFADLPAGSYVAQDALGSAEVEVTLVPGEARTIEWKVADEFVVRVRVEHADGSPAAGADVWCTRQREDPYLWRCGRVDAAGRLDLFAAGSVELQAALATHVPSELLRVQHLPEVEPGIREARLVLGPTGTRLRGTVRDVDEVPIAGARVVAGPRGGWRLRGMRGAAPHPVVVETDDRGAFEFAAALPVGTCEVSARAPEFAVRTIDVAARGTPLSVELVLGRGARIAGHVAFAGGMPARGSVVQFLSPYRADGQRGIAQRVAATVAADGSYELRHVPVGEHEVRAESPEDSPLARATRLVAVPAPAPEMPLVLDLTLSDEPSLTGHVVDRDGVPLAGLYVQLEAATGHRYPRELWTDADGHFRATCLPDDQVVRVGTMIRKLDGTVRSAGEWSVEVLAFGGGVPRVLGRRDHVSPGDALELVVERPVEPTAFLAGRVAWPDHSDGRVPADVELVAWGEDGMGAVLDFDHVRGRFRHGPVAAGTWRLEVRRQREVLVSRSGVAVADGETVDVGALVPGVGGTVAIRPVVVGAESIPADMFERVLERELRATLERAGCATQWLTWRNGVLVANQPLEEGTWRLTGECELLAIPALDVEVRPAETTDVEWELRVAR